MISHVIGYQGAGFQVVVVNLREIVLNALLHLGGAPDDAVHGRKVAVNLTRKASLTTSRSEYRETELIET